MQLILGRGNNRQTFELPSGREAQSLERENPIEFVKVKGNIMALIRANNARKEKN